MRNGDPPLYVLLLAGQVLGLLARLRPELPDEPEEDPLGEKKPDSDQDSDQKDEVVDVARVRGRLNQNTIQRARPSSCSG